MEREQAKALALVVHELIPDEVGRPLRLTTTAEKAAFLRRTRRAGELNRHRRDKRRARELNAAVTGRVDRAEIIVRDKSICHICGKVCAPEEIHLDHVIPLARGGVHGPENIKVACADCNIAKGASLPDDRIRLLRPS